MDDFKSYQDPFLFDGDEKVGGADEIDADEVPNEPNITPDDEEEGGELEEIE